MEIAYVTAGVAILIIGFALGMWVEHSVKMKEKEESDMTTKELVREITEKELYLKVLNKKRDETENKIKELQAQLEILEG